MIATVEDYKHLIIKREVYKEHDVVFIDELQVVAGSLPVVRGDIS